MVKPVNLNDTNFDSVVRKHSLVMIDFWTADCQPCKVVAPIVDDLAKKYEGELFVGAVRADENPNTARRFGIRGVPTLLVMKEGEEIDRINLQITDITQLMKDYIDEKLKRHLGKQEQRG